MKDILFLSLLILVFATVFVVIVAVLIFLIPSPDMVFVYILATTFALSTIGVLADTYNKRGKLTIVEEKALEAARELMNEILSGQDIAKDTRYDFENVMQKAKEKFGDQLSKEDAELIMEAVNLLNSNTVSSQKESFKRLNQIFPQ